MGVMIYSFNLNISPEMSDGVLECDYVIRLHAYDLVRKDFVIQVGLFLCRSPACRETRMSSQLRGPG